MAQLCNCNCAIVIGLTDAKQVRGRTGQYDRLEAPEEEEVWCISTSPTCF